MAVGPGRRDEDGVLLPMGVGVGDRVLLPQQAGYEVTVADKNLELFRDDEILRVLKDTV